MNKTIMTITVCMIAVMLIGLGFAAVNFFNSSVDVTVSEALSSTSTPVSVVAYPGETVQANFTIDNVASVSLPVSVDWAESTNANLVNYTTEPLSKTVVVAPGSNIISVNYIVETGSPVGTFDGTVTFTRI
jgi:cytochrome c oxidase assembly protein Cox11